MSYHLIGIEQALKWQEEQQVRTRIKDWIQESIRVKQAIHDDPQLRKQIEIASALMIGVIREGGTIYVCGNGGSASDSAHFVAELMNRFSMNREYPLPAIDLSAMNSTITAIANDYSYDEIFAKQLKALGKSEDLLIAISTSGNSPNVLKAMDQANLMGMLTVFLTGEGVDAKTTRAQHINVPSRNTPIIQEAHVMIIHMLCNELDWACNKGRVK
jgi:DnaA initiator-associating protein